MTSPVIFGFKSTVLSEDERVFFKRVDPFGYILFARNIDNPTQLKALTNSLRELSNNPNIPILIDQEGGRVARMRPPHWPEFPAAKTLVEHGCGVEETTCKLIYDNARKLAEMLITHGINVNCAPVADIPVVGADPIISDRAYGATPEAVCCYAKEMARGLSDHGVAPVLKHIPGHGRATVDSHLALPIVTTSLDELERTDFVPFNALKDLPYAMTAHVVYTALDAENCATFSPIVIRYIREKIGFKGILMSDDLSMKALAGSFENRTKRALAAGCDLILHCNGEMDEMQAIASAL
jgi:beta-N-acetylhexosaminidase